MEDTVGCWIFLPTIQSLLANGFIQRLGVDVIHGKSFLVIPMVLLLCVEIYLNINYTS